MHAQYICILVALLSLRSCENITFHLRTGSHTHRRPNRTSIIELAVVIPFIEREFPAVLNVLQGWRNLGQSCSEGTNKHVDLVFYSNNV